MTQEANAALAAGDDRAFLGGVNYFAGLPADALAEVRAGCHYQEYAPGTLITVTGEPGAALGIVRRGHVRVFATAPNGREQVFFVLGPGDTFGDVAAADRLPAPASVEALPPGAGVLLLPFASLDALRIAYPAIVANAAPVLAARVRQLTALVRALALQHRGERLAQVLLEEHARTGGPVALTQQELAARAGTVREVVSRTLRDFERQGIIARGAERAIHVDAAALSALAAHHDGEARATPSCLSRL